MEVRDAKGRVVSAAYVAVGEGDERRDGYTDVSGRRTFRDITQRRHMVVVRDPEGGSFRGSADFRTAVPETLVVRIQPSIPP